MLEFGNLKYLYYVIIPIAVIIITIYGFNKKNKIIKVLNLKIKKNIEIIKIVLYFLGTCFIFISLLSPQKLEEKQKREVKGVDIYAVIDTSNSMLAEDVYPNRLEKSKKIIGEILLDNLKGDRVGFIPFSDSAYVQMPLTDDYSMAKNYLSAIDTTLISGGGTNLISALEMAEKSFKDSGTKTKIVVIFSDGGDYQEEVANYSKNSDLKIFSFGIGTLEGSTIPLYEKGIKKEFIKDSKGNIVISSLNSRLLKEISKEGYYEVNNLQDGTKEFMINLDKLEKTALREEEVDSYKKLFQFPLLIGILLILIAFSLRGGIKNEK